EANEPLRAGPWRADASYLVTGGLGDIGLAVARSMVAAGARRLVLLDSTAMPPRREWADHAGGEAVGRRAQAVRELEALGASVMLETLDVTDEGQLGSFVLRFE